MSKSLNGHMSHLSFFYVYAKSLFIGGKWQCFQLGTSSMNSKIPGCCGGVKKSIALFG